jgi:hypothetical protein
VCLDPAQLPNNQVQSCCREPCSTYTVATATGPKRFDNICCAWPVQEVSTGTGAVLRVCCPPDQTALSDGTCCRQQQLCGPPGKQVCCPDSQSCQPVLPFSSSGPTACCAQVGAAALLLLLLLLLDSMLVLSTAMLSQPCSPAMQRLLVHSLGTLRPAPLNVSCCSRVHLCAGSLNAYQCCCCCYCCARSLYVWCQQSAAAARLRGPPAAACCTLQQRSHACTDAHTMKQCCVSQHSPSINGPESQDVSAAGAAACRLTFASTLRSCQAAKPEAAARSPAQPSSPQQARTSLACAAHKEQQLSLPQTAPPVAYAAQTASLHSLMAPAASQPSSAQTQRVTKSAALLGSPARTASAWISSYQPSAQRPM